MTASSKDGGDEIALNASGVALDPRLVNAIELALLRDMPTAPSKGKRPTASPAGLSSTSTLGLAPPSPHNQVRGKTKPQGNPGPGKASKRPRLETMQPKESDDENGSDDDMHRQGSFGRAAKHPEQVVRILSSNMMLTGDDEASTARQSSGEKPSDPSPLSTAQGLNATDVEEAAERNIDRAHTDLNARICRADLRLGIVEGHLKELNKRIKKEKEDRELREALLGIRKETRHLKDFLEKELAILRARKEELSSAHFGHAFDEYVARAALLEMGGSMSPTTESTSGRDAGFGIGALVEVPGASPSSRGKASPAAVRASKPTAIAPASKTSSHDPASEDLTSRFKEQIYTTNAEVSQHMAEAAAMSAASAFLRAQEATVSRETPTDQLAAVGPGASATNAAVPGRPGPDSGRNDAESGPSFGAAGPGSSAFVRDNHGMIIPAGYTGYLRKPKNAGGASNVGLDSKTIQREAFKLLNAKPASLHKNTLFCSCRKSKCLKLYCDCFAASMMCSGCCTCVECRNQPQYSRDRLVALENILKRKPYAFHVQGRTYSKTESARKLEVGCNCRRTLCLKKYCICFSNGDYCKASCRCLACGNKLSNPKALDNFLLKKGKPAQTDAAKPLLALYPGNAAVKHEKAAQEHSQGEAGTVPSQEDSALAGASQASSSSSSSSSTETSQESSSGGSSI